MESIKNNIIKFKSNNKFKFFLWNTEKLIKDLILFTVKSFIACSILFLFITIFVWNIQIQVNCPTSNGIKNINNIDVVQCLPLKELLKEWYYER